LQISELKAEFSFTPESDDEIFNHEDTESMKNHKIKNLRVLRDFVVKYKKFCYLCDLFGKK